MSGRAVARAVPAGEGVTPELTSLAPAYVAERHRTYLALLERALEDPRNRNIALTGRYGAGKSSVLDEFVRRQGSQARRLAISTLAPGDVGVPLTNRIQKELVKQLLYSASSATVRSSRFARITPLKPARAILEALLVVLVMGGILALLGALPPVVGTKSDDWRLAALAWAGFGALLTVVVAGVRWVTYARFFVSDVAAGGAAVKLSADTATFFDEYLEEIVHFFNVEEPDVVVLEDLDRFDDPKIFEALRELNTLLNNTPARLKKDKPLRFVYAVRDSLFERLGQDTRAVEDDAAAAETVRANRTKFFDLVIPVVPFISPRNARELLAGLLTEAGIEGVDQRLVELVAQHATDMRLLVNMRNEYLVFAERLLAQGRTAPGLTATKLFALVAFKNFHLEEFEQISRRSSVLDRLYEQHGALVRAETADLESRKRQLLSLRRTARFRGAEAERLAARLAACADLVRQRSPYGHLPHVRYRAGSEDFSPAESGVYEFWQAAAESGKIEMLFSAQRDAGGQRIATLDTQHLQALLPEALAAGRWAELDLDEAAGQLAQIERDITFLRGSSFQTLGDEERFKLEVGVEKRSFRAIVHSLLPSPLAIELVLRGYIDRNFTLYSAQFYGAFTGVDVATFMVQAVEPNTVLMDFQLSSADVENLLQEAPEDFTTTVSAYNISVLNVLLGRDDPRASPIVDRIVRHFDEQAQALLASYFTSGEHGTALAKLLGAAGWSRVFEYLVRSPDVPDSARPDLVSAALLTAKPSVRYPGDEDLRKFLLEHYLLMPAFTTPQDEVAGRGLVDVLARLGAVLPVLQGLDEALRREVVQRDMFAVTAPNLRLALGNPVDVALDVVRSSAGIYQYCLDHPSEYLTAVEQDPGTAFAVLEASALQAVLADVEERWEPSLVRSLLATVAPQCRVSCLDDVPQQMWPLLAEQDLFELSLTNVEAYRLSFGLDAVLGGRLSAAEAITVEAADPSELRTAVALALLAARDAVPSAAQRVRLVLSLQPATPLPLDEVQPEPGELLALLIRHRLVPDAAESFELFDSQGWSALEPAIIASRGFADFMSSELLDGHIPAVLRAPVLRDRLGPRILERLQDLVGEEDRAALVAAATFAFDKRSPLTPEQVVRLAGPESAVVRVVPALLLEAAPAASAEQIVEALGALDGAYRPLRTGEPEQFEVPFDDTHRKLLQVLGQAGMCKYAKHGRVAPRYRVTLRSAA